MAVAHNALAAILSLEARMLGEKISDLGLYGLGQQRTRPLPPFRFAPSQTFGDSSADLARILSAWHGYVGKRRELRPNSLILLQLGVVNLQALRVAADSLILLQLGGVSNCFVTLRIAAVSHLATMDPDQPERQGEHRDD
jgi:hypothetical protein